MQCTADFDEFEATIKGDMRGAARALGCAYPTYAQYRKGTRTLPDYHAQHMRAILLLSKPALRIYLEECHGRSD